MQGSEFEGFWADGKASLSRTNAKYFLETEAIVEADINESKITYKWSEMSGTCSGSQQTGHNNSNFRHHTV